MKFLLFDDILETHVRRSLARGLERRGHEVIVSPKVWRGHYPPTEAEDIAHINDALDAALSKAPDVLFNLRASTLTPDMLARVRAAKVLSMVWLHDDPVLHRVCYAGVVEHYDIVLNCGGTEILNFYRERHGIRGVNFPFWTDSTEFPRVRFSTSDSDYDFAFLGNLKGPVRQRRYDMIAALPGRIRIYGKADRDPAGLVKGYLDTEAEVAEALAPARIALNIPQIFSDYRGNKYDFDGMARLGSFEYPSRVIQYAALGLPVFTLGVAQPPAGFPEMLAGSTVADATPMLRDLLKEPERLAALSDSTHERFNSSFSADARAALLERLVEDAGPILSADATYRAEVFAQPDAAPPRHTFARCSLTDKRRALEETGAEAARKFRILLCAPAGDGIDTSSHLRALRNLGHAVTFLPSPATPLDVLKCARSFRAGVALFAGLETVIPAAMRSDLADAGCHVVEVASGALPMGVDLTWMVEPAPEGATKRPADILFTGPARKNPTLEHLCNAFALVETFGAGSQADRLAGLDRGLICVLTDDGDASLLYQAVARGTVAAIPQTHPVATMFTPGSEVVTYSDAEDLVAKIAQVLADPTERHRMRRRAFDRLARDYLLERQWEDRLRDLPAPSIAREIRVLVTGYYGHQNLGDELILDSLMGIAARIRPEITFCVVTAAAESLHRARGIETVALGDVPALSRIAPTVDAAILGGGGLWHDYSFEAAGGVRALYDGAARSIGGYIRPNLMAAACGAQSHAYGLGVGPLTNPEAQALLRHVTQHMDSITVRDPASRDILRDIPGWTKPVSIAPDMVYGFDLAEALANAPEMPQQDWTDGNPVLAVNLRDWALGDLDQLTTRIAAALKPLLRDRPHALLGVPMQQKNGIDAKALDLLFSKIPETVPRKILNWKDDGVLALKALDQADLVLAMRLHTCLLAHRLGKPVVGCSYDPKVTAHFAELGREDFLFDFETQPGQLELRLRRAAEESGQLPHPITDRVRALEKSSLDAMKAFIAGLPAARPERPLRTANLTPPGAAAQPEHRRRRDRSTLTRLRKLFARISGRG